MGGVGREHVELHHPERGPGVGCRLLRGSAKIDPAGAPLLRVLCPLNFPLQPAPVDWGQAEPLRLESDLRGEVPTFPRRGRPPEPVDEDGDHEKAVPVGHVELRCHR